MGACEIENLLNTHTHRHTHTLTHCHAKKILLKENLRKLKPLTRTLQIQLVAINRETFEQLSPVDPMLNSLHTLVLLYCIEFCKDVPVLHCIFPLASVNGLNENKRNTQKIIMTEKKMKINKNKTKKKEFQIYF